ncbi:hypothetical protein NESM_000035900 [Novymonas esmeraldas]|uniref:Queuosine 5'-phosphate N-glycosylase/hydrolase n=1 Tax=Novymonas esmeraldas TaxID=1808958 RepID=A0AAW0F3P4_9TRYP
MACSAASSYGGGSVRGAIRRLYGGRPAEPLTILHATVPPVTSRLLHDGAHVLNAVLDCLRDQQLSTSSEQSAATATPTSHWLLSVPAPLRQDEAAVVNYLGMMVAIDFCHWAEVGGAVPARPGDAVTGFAGFYAVVEEEPAGGPSEPHHGGAPSGTTERLTEPPSQAPAVSDGCATPTKPLLRGSAAMMYLLRRAVEVHGVAWYDPHYLQRWGNDAAAATEALRVCFLGCAADGVTPLWMPCTRERVELLLSLADALVERHTSFHAILRECGGCVFASTAAAAGHVGGLVPALIRLHPRYSDFAQVPVCRSGGAVEGLVESCTVPVLKLAQLTALALEQALPALWSCRAACSASSEPRPSAPAPSAPDSWLERRRAAHAARAHTAKSGATATSPLPSVGLFADIDELSVCCDYQIPRTLRAAGLLVYDDHLAWAVDHHILLAPGSAEETSIRVATLVAADRLMGHLNAAPTGSADGAACAAPDGQAPFCAVHHLDYALWYVGRYMVSSDARHHLCRTVMY